MVETTLITGANRGIGLELARQYAAAGWRVFTGCRHPENAAALKDLAAGSAGRLTIHRLDVTDADARERLLAEVADTPIDILINNAGVIGQRENTFGNTDETLWIETLRVNAMAPLKMMETLVDAVAASKRKIIVNITSRMGSIGDNTSGGSYVYRSSKAALNAAAKGAANDLRARGVTVIVLHPGWVRTDMGGPRGILDVRDSVAQIRALLERISLRDSGQFFNFDGTTIPW